MLLCFALFILGAIAQCPQSSDPCTSLPCPPTTCGGFTVLRIQTDQQSPPVTTIEINATNFCPKSKGAVYYVQFHLGPDSKGNTMTVLPSGSTYNGFYSWVPSTVQDKITPTATKTPWIRFTANNAPNDKMYTGSSTSAWEKFTFRVTGYDPVFEWYMQLHIGSLWDTYGPLDMSNCRCTNCDAGYTQRTIQPCTLGYATCSGKTCVYDGPTNRAKTIFNENKVLYTYGVYDNYLALFYTDEWPMCLGVDRVVNQLTGSTTYHLVSPQTPQPTCIYTPNIKFGATSWLGTDPEAGIDGNGQVGVPGCSEVLMSNGRANNTWSCGRPMAPTLFYTDITNNPDDRSGDWQFAGQGFLPHKVCGLWQSSTKTIRGSNADGTYIFSTVPSTSSRPATNANPPGNGAPFWNLGAGADPPPLGFINPSAVPVVPYLEQYGVEVAWDLDKIPGLKNAHSYRFQFMVHDGDATKVGGDVGQGCIITNVACPAGFSGTNCDVCDDNPLPKDSKWTWWCSPTKSQPPYTLLKLPISKVTDPNGIYKNSGGFIPSENYLDPQGYRVGCDCVRKVVPCPADCCGNGVCNSATGKCTCKTVVVGMNSTTCCTPPPTLPPTPPPTPPPVPPPTCINATQPPFGSNNCSSCISNVLGLVCGWCPQNVTAQPPSLTLTQGSCKPVGTCGGPEFRVCTAPPPPPPPPPPGQSCVNTTFPPLGSMNCSSCVSNTIGLICGWCPNNVTIQPPDRTLTEGRCAPINECGGPEFRICVAPPPPPPPPSCPTIGTFLNRTVDCDLCIGNPLGLQCGWCPTVSGDVFADFNASLATGTCVAYGACNTTILTVCAVPPCLNGGKFCNGNGNCVNNTCNCTPPAVGVTCEPPPPCYNDGNFCSGKGNCVNGTCECIPEPPLSYTGVACNETIFPPPLKCSNISGAYNCSSCLALGQALGLQCAWCPNSTDPYQALSSGVCTEDYVCGNLSYYACIPPHDFIPPECPDNCTGNGICVNTSFCEWIYNQKGHQWQDKSKPKDEKGKYPVYTCDPAVLNLTRSRNQTAMCACIAGKSGINCADVGFIAALAAGLAAGILALIIVLGLLGLAICGGGAYAASTAAGAGMGAGTVNNPIYSGNQTEGSNPLFSGN